jgi:glycosyltransferase involved in cell wall biosynthesis
MGMTIMRTATRSPARDGSPLVSICIPTYNGAPWIGEAIESALAQDYQRLEIIICDDASSDETVAMARTFGDPRVRVLSNAVRVGMARNWNRCVRASTGDYVKLLMQDDRLAPACVGRMVEVMEAHPAAGLIFSPREILLDDPDDPDALLWKERFGILHTPFGPLAQVNDGRAMFDRMRSDRFRGCWMGEPTAVMIRRRALQDVGLFNARLRQVADLEMWLRMAFFHDVGFVPDPLVTIRVHSRSATAVNGRTGAAWLDRVWLVEGLRAHPDIRVALGRWAEALIWYSILRSSGKRLLGDRRWAKWPQGADFRNYVRFRLAGGYDSLHEALTLTPADDDAQFGA